MSRVISILFSGLILVQSFSISYDDLSKLNVLINHADYHQITYGDNFLDFLVEHYDEDSYKQNSNHEEHKNLPFKHKHRSSTHVDTSFTCNTSFFDLGYKSFIQIPSNFFYIETISNYEKLSIFQPPKVA